jgi:hypothetical protein
MAYVIGEGNVRKVCRAKDPAHCRYHKQADGTPLKHYTTRAEVDQAIEDVYQRASSSKKLSNQPFRVNLQDDMDIDESLIDGLSADDFNRQWRETRDALIHYDADAINAEYDQYAAKSEAQLQDINDQLNPESLYDQKDHTVIRKTAQAALDAHLQRQQSLSDAQKAMRNPNDVSVLQHQTMNIRNLMPHGERYLEGIQRRQDALGSSLLNNHQDILSCTRNGDKVSFTFRGDKPGSMHRTSQWSISLPASLINVKAGLDAEAQDSASIVSGLQSYLQSDLTHDKRGLKGLESDTAHIETALRHAGRKQDISSMTHDLGSSLWSRRDRERKLRGQSNQIKDAMTRAQQQRDHALNAKQILDEQALRLQSFNGMKPVKLSEHDRAGIITRYQQSKNDANIVTILGRNDRDQFLIQSESDPNYQYAERIGHGPGESWNTIRRAVVDRHGVVQKLSISNDVIRQDWQVQ